jgi:DNA-binding response OmpR family regulator
MFIGYNNGHMSQKKILIIEDSPDLADSLEDMLKFKGYETLKSNNGIEGATLALAEKPDLILLDLKLPDIDGYEVYRKLRGDEWGNAAKILILTASDTLEPIPDDLDVNPDDILRKSNWGIDNLASRIEEELAK